MIRLFCFWFIPCNSWFMGISCNLANQCCFTAQKLYHCSSLWMVKERPAPHLDKKKASQPIACQWFGKQKQICKNEQKQSDYTVVWCFLFTWLIWWYRNNLGNYKERMVSISEKRKYNTWLCLWWKCLSLLCWAMCSASQSSLCARHTACLWVFWGEGVVERTERRKRDKERQRRTITSDAVCPHLISGCFQCSWCSPPSELYIGH